MKKSKSLLLLTAAALILGNARGGGINVKAVPKESGRTAAHYRTMPESSVTNKNPFIKDTAGSASFRIPALVTLKDGTMVAAADIRWDTTFDGGGLDTIVSYSSDDGETWTNTFANYLGDNGNKYNGGESTCFIDPCLVTNGEKLWLMTDIYPWGVALNGTKKKAPDADVTGFDGKGNLLLRKGIAGGFDYHLDLTDYKIYKNEGKVAVDGYEVDKHFNIKNEDGTEDSNLFFKTSPFQVQETSYLYLVSSEDGGKTWSEPSLINLKNQKNGEEKAFLVGPGRGVYTEKGYIIIPTYGHNDSNPNERTSFVYSTDQGKTWHRSENALNKHSSEAAVVELPNGNLRFFYRHRNPADKKLSYVDAVLGEVKDDGELKIQWKEPVVTDILTNTSTQLSAVMYPETIDGKPVILVSAPAGPNDQGSDNPTGGPGQHRVNGKIFVGLVEEGENNPISWLPDPKRIGAMGSEFMYSCLTVTKEGEVALLYEDTQVGWGAGAGKYFTIDFKKYPIKELIGDKNLDCSALNKVIKEFEELKAEDFKADDKKNSDDIYAALKTAVEEAKQGITDGEDLATLKDRAATITGLIEELRKALKTEKEELKKKHETIEGWGWIGNQMAEELKKQEEAKKQEELKKQEETKKQEELKKQEETKKQEELKKQEEAKKQEELKKQEEAKKQEELKKQEAAKKQEEIKEEKKEVEKETPLRIRNTRRNTATVKRTVLEGATGEEKEEVEIKVKKGSVLLAKEEIFDLMGEKAKDMTISLKSRSLKKETKVMKEVKKILKKDILVSNAIVDFQIKVDGKILQKVKMDQEAVVTMSVKRLKTDKNIYVLNMKTGEKIKAKYNKKKGKITFKTKSAGTFVIVKKASKKA